MGNCHKKDMEQVESEKEPTHSAPLQTLHIQGRTKELRIVRSSARMDSLRNTKSPDRLPRIDTTRRKIPETVPIEIMVRHTNASQEESILVSPADNVHDRCLEALLLGPTLLKVTFGGEEVSPSGTFASEAIEHGAKISVRVEAVTCEVQDGGDPYQCYTLDQNRVLFRHSDVGGQAYAKTVGTNQEGRMATMITSTRATIRELGKLKEVLHRQCVLIHEVFFSNGELTLIQELMEEDLEQPLSRASTQSEQWPLTGDQAGAVFHKICAGVAHLHSCGVSCSGLKTDDVLLKIRGELLSSKIAKIGFLADDAVLGDSVPGSPYRRMAYMPPEMVKRKARFNSFRVDSWSLGILLYRLCAGTLPFKGESHGNKQQRSKLLHCEYEFGPEWDARELSAPRHIIRQLLKKMFGDRWTARQCLDHPWVASKENAAPMSVRF